MSPKRRDEWSSPGVRSSTRSVGMVSAVRPARSEIWLLRKVPLRGHRRVRESLMESHRQRPRLLFVVESGTDVRLVEGLARRFRLEILAREIPGGVAINRETNQP